MYVIEHVLEVCRLPGTDHFDLPKKALPAACQVLTAVFVLDDVFDFGKRLLYSSRIKFLLHVVLLNHLPDHTPQTGLI